ncbi:eukaryotic translation initiation factor 4 gamma 3-like [Takifugu rubripes]|uniref:eukaryotic translation initiation factor 4 gamma 3-like n=1 Tax=Takifugu rubripes TaxID=31033 RepID=UPI0011459EAD|nr:eukaryotic translation initiation factor 4 gamma 3-like [Takifugu rubripes]
MCHHLKGLMVSSQSSKGFVYFHKLLLKRCQMEFQNGHCKSELLKEKENDVSAAQEEGERQQLKVDLEQTRHKARVRLLGTVRFIGELFKLRMISEAIIPTCVVKLIKDECEESLECLCKLLSIVGKDLDTETERPKLNSYNGYICHLLKEWKMSTRIKFMLQDVLALRKNNWVPCRKDEGPKTIKQLHQEVKLAEEREQPQSRNKQTTMQQRGGGRLWPIL